MQILHSILKLFKTLFSFQICTTIFIQYLYHIGLQRNSRAVSFQLQGISRNANTRGLLTAQQLSKLNLNGWPREIPRSKTQLLLNGTASYPPEKACVPSYPAFHSNIRAGHVYQRPPSRVTTDIWSHEKLFTFFHELFFLLHSFVTSPAFRGIITIFEFPFRLSS